MTKLRAHPFLPHPVLNDGFVPAQITKIEGRQTDEGDTSNLPKNRDSIIAEPFLYVVERGARPTNLSSGLSCLLTC